MGVCGIQQPGRGRGVWEGYAPTLLLPMINTFRFIVVPAAAELLTGSLCCCVFVAAFFAAVLAPRA